MDRKKLKKRAKQNLKRHYWLLMALCLFAAFAGIEYGSSFLNLNITQTESAGVGSEDGTTIGETLESILVDMAIGEEDEARRQVKTNQKNIREHDRSKIFGRSRGVLSLILNSFASGGILLTISDGIRSIGVSKNVSIIFLVLLSLIFYIFVWLFLKETYRIVSRRMILESRIYERVPIQRFLYPIQTRQWPRMAWNMFVVTVYQTLWTLTIIGGIIKYYSYYLVPYILAENPSIKAKEAITLSRYMMKGYKWKCFVADLSFWGWDILNLLTCGLVGVFYSNPYKAAFYSEFYVSVREHAQQKGIPGVDLLSDKYLYEKAQKDTLYEAYADVAKEIYAQEEKLDPPGGISGLLSTWFGIMPAFSKKVAEYEEQEARIQQRRLGREILAGQSYPGRLAPAVMRYRLGTIMNLVPTRSYTVLNLVFMFLIFSIIGWIWEVALHLISDGVFVNRGVLHGPWLPIYGMGGVLILVILKRWRKKPILEFIAAMALCGCVEYFTAWYLEMTQNGQKWWDYTGYFLNLHGRICAEGLLIFGLGGLAIVYLVAPLLDNQLKKMNRKYLTIIGTILFVIYMGDQIYSIKHPNTGQGITDYTKVSFISHDLSKKQEIRS